MKYLSLNGKKCETHTKTKHDSMFWPQNNAWKTTEWAKYPDFLKCSSI